MLVEQQGFSFHNAIAAKPARSELARSLARFRRNRLAVASVGVIVIIGVLALLAPVLSNHVLGWEPDQIDYGHMYAGPSGHHLLGTDELGRDVLVRLLYGSRISISIGLLVVVVSISLGLVVGGIGGYAGGLVDNVLMRITDALLSIPTFFLLLAVSTYAMDFTIVGIILAIGLTSWMGVARIMRAEFLSVLTRDYVLAARALGARDRRIILHHILPNAIHSLIVAATLGVGNGILIESALSFLGLGVRAPSSSWGSMLNNSQLYVWKAPMLAVYPGLSIMLTVLAFNFVGDGLREALDPRLSR
ncbi:MAG: ABC transporter permease [Chloroflexota bacterium]